VGSEAPASVEPKRSMRANMSLILPMLAKYSDSSILSSSTPCTHTHTHTHDTHRTRRTHARTYDTSDVVGLRLEGGGGWLEGRRASMGLAWVNWEMSLNLLVLGILPRMARWGRDVFLMIHSTEIASEMVMPSSTPSTTAPHHDVSTTASAKSVADLTLAAGTVGAYR